ncbi:MAG: hypothetical protein ACFFD4_14420 [Candidatus Odinarchaeota archaeon]
MLTREFCSFELRTGRIKLEFRFIKVGTDLICLVAGGKSHLGAASIAEIYHKSGKIQASASTISVHGHQDGVITSMIAESLAKQLQCNVLTVAGIHIDNISKDEIKTVISLCEEAIKKFIPLYARS